MNRFTGESASPLVHLKMSDFLSVMQEWLFPSPPLCIYPPPRPDQLSRTRSPVGVNAGIGHLRLRAIASDSTPWIQNNPWVQFGPLVDASPILPFPDASPCAVVKGSGSQAYPYILVIQPVP